MDNSTYAILIDLIVGLVALLIVIGGWKKGFLRMAVLLVGYVASVIAAFWLSKWVAGTVYQYFIRDAIAQSIDKAVSMSSEGLPFGAVLSNVFDKLPGFVVNPILAGFGGEEALVEGLQNMTGGVLAQLGPVITDTIVEPIITSLIQMFSCLLIFIVCVIIVKTVAAAFKGFYAIPILGPVNSALGAVLGFVKAAILLWLAALVVSMLVALSADSWSWLNTQIIDRTVLFKPLYHFAAGA